MTAAFPPEAFDARLEGTSSLSPTTKSFRFRLTGDREMPFKAGQHVQVLVPATDGLKRFYYSLASSPRDTKGFELCVTAVPGGAGSGSLHGLRAGATVKVLGPFGKFVLPDRLERDPVFVATGSGVAPLRSMILDLLEGGATRAVTLLSGHRGEADILYRAPWGEAMCAHPNFRAIFTLSAPPDGWLGPRGYVQDVLADAVAGWGEKEFFLCGWKTMIEAMAAMIQAGGVPPERIHFEKYG